MLGAEFADFLEIGLNSATTFARQLAPDQIKGLDAVGPFVDHGDAGIANKLLNTLVLGVTRATEDLLGHDGVVEPLVGEHAFDDGCQQFHEVVGCQLRFRVFRAAADVPFQRRPQQECAARFVE